MSISRRVTNRVSTEAILQKYRRALARAVAAIAESEVTCREQPDEIAIGIGLTYAAMTAEERRIVDPGLPGGRILVEQHVDVHRFRTLEIVAGERRRIAVQSIGERHARCDLPTRDHATVVGPVEIDSRPHRARRP